MELQRPEHFHSTFIRFRLPVLESDRFEPEFYTQCNDVALLTYLGTIMKSCDNLNQFINKFNMLYQRQGPGRRMRGLFF